MSNNRNIWYTNGRINVMDLVVVALFAALQFVVNFLIQGVAALHPAAPPVISALLNGFIIVLLGLMIRKRGSIALFGIPHGALLAISPAITLGPHWFKFVAVLGMHMLLEGVLLSMRRREKMAAVVLGGVVGMCILYSFVLMVWVVSLTTAEFAGMLAEQLPKVLQVALLVTPAALATGVAGGWLAYGFYSRISETALVKRLRSWK